MQGRSDPERRHDHTDNPELRRNEGVDQTLLASESRDHLPHRIRLQHSRRVARERSKQKAESNEGGGPSDQDTTIETHRQTPNSMNPAVRPSRTILQDSTSQVPVITQHECNGDKEEREAKVETASFFSPAGKEE
jgi:hypothetical protein